MEPTGTLRFLSPRQNLRQGQRNVVEHVLRNPTGIIPVQLPTGYGKTLTAAWTFVELMKRDVVDRLLVVVPTIGQLDSFLRSGHEDFLDAGLAGVRIFNLDRSPSSAMKKSRSGELTVFACTVQSLGSAATALAVREMFERNKWMLVPDEYHHYGIGKAWTRSLPIGLARVVLAMSATPARAGDDSAFGAPVVRASYRGGVEEGVLKELRLYSYEYQIDAVTANGKEISFTTSELIDAVGSNSPLDIEEYITKNKLRWSPKYITPLISKPLERIFRYRQHNPQIPFQAIVGAMCVSHAKMVCEYIRELYPELSVDWVGTGPSGRSDAENREILQRFCPPKDRSGKRNPANVRLDVLVHVAMAGEGLDSPFITEVIHLNSAGLSNQNDQENGRAARRISGVKDRFQIATINVDSSSPYARYTGKKIINWIDRDCDIDDQKQDDEEDPDWEDFDDLDFPDEPVVVIADCKLTNIDKGDPEVIEHARNLVGLVKQYDESDLANPNHPIWEHAIKLRRMEMAQTAENGDLMSELHQLQQSITGKNGIGGECARHAARISIKSRNTRVTSSEFSALTGSMRKRLYTFLKRRFGEAIEDADSDGLRQRFAYVKNEILAGMKTTGDLHECFK